MGLIIAGTVLGGRLASFDLLAAGLAGVVARAARHSVARCRIRRCRGRRSCSSGASSPRPSRIARRSSRPITRARGMPPTRPRANLDRSPLSAIFLMAHGELKRFAKYRGRAGGEAADEAQRRTVGRQIAWAATQESLRLESRLAAPRHDRQRHALRRPVRHRDRHHQRLHRHRRIGQREPRGGRARASPRR